MILIRRWMWWKNPMGLLLLLNDCLAWTSDYEVWKIILQCDTVPTFLFYPPLRIIDQFLCSSFRTANAPGSAHILGGPPNQTRKRVPAMGSLALQPTQSWGKHLLCNIAPVALTSRSHCQWPPPPRATPIIVPPHLRASNPKDTPLAAISTTSVSNGNAPSANAQGTSSKGKGRNKSSSLHKAVLDRLEVQKAMSEMEHGRSGGL